MTFASHFKTFPALETHRLKLRQLSGKDAERYWTLVSAIPEGRWGANERQSIEAAERRINQCNNHFKKKAYIRWGLCLKPKGDLVGMCELFDFHNASRAEMGYWLGIPYRGQGLMAEAVNGVAPYAFETLGLRRLTAFTAADNAESIRMLTSAGFEMEGTLRQYRRDGGDTVVLGRVSDSGRP